MRRPGIIIFMLVLVLSLMSIKSNKENHDMKDNKKVEVVGKIVNIVEKEKSTQYILEKYICVSYKKNEKLKIGDIVIFEGNEKNLDDFYIKDFNYGRYIKSRGFSRYINIDKSRVIGRDRHYSIIGKIKYRLIEINRFLYKNGSNILNSIVLGDRSTVTEEEKQIFSETGTSHIMAISGLHISIISGIILIFLGKVNSYKRFVLLGIILYFYNELVGGGQSINRAIIMTLMTSFCFFIDKKCDIINLLFLIASFMVFENKYVIYNISFQLSFMAVLSICIFTKYLRKFIYFDIFITTISASILTAPIVLYNFLNISTVSLVGNLVVLPFIGIIIIGDIVSILFFYLDFSIATLISSINLEIIRGVMYFLNRVGNFGVNNIYIRSTNIYLLVLYYFIVICISLYLEYYFIRINKMREEV